MSVPIDLNTLNYPVETDLQKKFWASRHKCNKMKSIIAFSLDLDNANDNLRRYGYTRAWRKKAILAFGQYVNQYQMTGIPFQNFLHHGGSVCLLVVHLYPLMFVDGLTLRTGMTVKFGKCKTKE